MLDVRTCSALLSFLLSGLLVSFAAASCHISTEWSTEVSGRSNTDVSAILPAPYCLLLSDKWGNGTGSFYALNVRDGSVAWQWPESALGDNVQAVQLLPSVTFDRVYALVSWDRDVRFVNRSVCSLLAALYTGDGSVIWQHQLCYPIEAGVGAGFTVIPQPQQSNGVSGERIIHAIGNTDSDTGAPLYMSVDVLDGWAGQRLSSANLSDVLAWTVQTLGNSVEGYFSVETALDSKLQLFQLSADDSVQLVSTEPVALMNCLLQSQPALRTDSNEYPTQLMAIDVATNKLLWASDDGFLVGAKWTPSGSTFTHFSTAYELVDAAADLFIVLNTAYNSNGSVTVVAQAGAYQLADGKEVSRSPLLTYKHLSRPSANPTTWQFGDILLLRGDTVWYTLQLPSLQLVGAGQYATPDASVQSNNWLVDPDGSYVAVLYGRTSEIRGYQPYVNNKEAKESKQPVGVQHRHVKHG